MELVYPPVIGAVLSVYKLMGWPIDVQGAEHVPATGGGVLASNHIGYLDFTFIGYGAREQERLVRFMAKQEVFDHRVSGPLMRGMKHVPVDRFGSPGEALRAAIDALQGGELIGMFPEGTISRSFVPARAKTGAARMAMEAGVPLVPCAVWGSQRILTKGRPRNLQRGVAISVAYDAPIDYTSDDDPAEVTKRLMTAIEVLVDRLQRTYPQQPAGPDDRWWLPAHLGGTAPTVAESEAMAAEERERRRRKRQEREGRSEG
jgi:1-acyl-sn-glycerol-3-phosphate acyltransferase